MNTWVMMVSMAFILGIRHGFDLDHLATIDSITRVVSRNRFFSRIIGLLFSLGHGLVVITISLLIGSGLMQSQAPEWLKTLGNWVSIIFLLIFGIVNLWSIFQSPSKSNTTVSLKGYLAGKIISQNFNPLYVILIGALFALSFDTFSQVALFSLTANVIAGWLLSGLLGLVFMFGMMTADGLNGYLVSTLIQRTNKISNVVSRITGLIISLFSMITAVLVYNG